MPTFSSFIERLERWSQERRHIWVREEEVFTGLFYGGPRSRLELNAVVSWVGFPMLPVSEPYLAWDALWFRERFTLPPVTGKEVLTSTAVVDKP